MRTLRSLLWISTATLLLAACSSNDGDSSTPTEQLEPEDMGGLDGEGKFDAWDSANNPAYVDSNFAYLVHQLPLQGHGQVPVPGDYWATYKDNINHEWDGAGSSPAEKYATAFNKPEVVANVTKYHGIESATGRKKCTQGGNECSEPGDGSCSIPKGATEGRCIPSWWGICHGWAPYALTEPAARNPVTKNGVTFYPGDLEGLMSLLYTNVRNKFLSRRCNKEEPITDPTGRIEANECRDMNAGSFHVLAANLMGLRNQGFVIDATYSDQVWNQPSYGYTVTNGVDGALKEITKTEAINMLGLNLTLTSLFETVDLPKGETKVGEYVAPADGDYVIKMTGSGDADLYVKKGADATKTDYDCRPYASTSTEDCTVTLAAGEKVGYFIEGYGETSKIQLGVAVPGASGEYTYNTNAERFFYVETDFVYITESSPAKTSHVDSALSSYATTKHYKYILETDRDGKIQGGEWVGESRTNHPDFAWWPTSKPQGSMAGGLITYDEVKALNEEAAGEPPLADETVTVLDNVTVRKTGTTWASKYGSIVVEKGYKNLEVKMPGTGDADLYVRVGRNPTIYKYDCKSVTEGTSEESCSVKVSFDGNTYFVRARSKTPDTTVTVTATKLTQ